MTPEPSGNSQGRKDIGTTRAHADSGLSLKPTVTFRNHGSRDLLVIGSVAGMKLAHLSRLARTVGWSLQMATESKRRHVFISHHHADDEHLERLGSLLRNAGYDIRNSSIRAKPANQRRLDRGEVQRETIRRLLRMKISWAGKVVVLVGRHTHERPWVAWEIEQAHRQGKRIVGVFTRGGTDADVPAALNKYGSAIVGWNSNAIMRAIDGDENPFEDSDGNPRPPVQPETSVQCS